MSKKKFDPADTKEMTDELDQSAFFRSLPTPPPAGPTSSVSANAELQKSALLHLQISANAEAQRAALRRTYDKTSYRLCPEAFEAIETAKGSLKRTYGIKASYEDIADIALIVAREDLEKNGEQSELVTRLSAFLQKQK